MTIDDIRKLVAEGESRTLELKKTTGELKDAMHTACAFLNTEGGWLIIGVTPTSHNIIGQEVTDNTQQEIANALAGIEPTVYIPVEYIDVPDRPGYKVIAMKFDGWVPTQEPYTYHGCPYYKVESTTKVMPRDLYKDRLQTSRPTLHSWERELADDVSFSDLDANRIKGCVRLGVEGGRLPASALSESTEEILEKFALLTDGQPNNGAAMLFSKKTHQYSQLRLKLARFRGLTKSAFDDNQLAEGNFFDLLDAGMSFFFKHLNLSGEIKGLLREEKLEIPVPALREALINALCHCRWELYNLNINIAIYDDRIEIANPGVFPPQITPENIKLPHDSYPYNPNIAETLYRSTFLESWGSGARRIIEACQAQGVATPTWSFRGAFVVVTFTRPSTIQVGDKYDTSTPLVTPRATPLATPLVQDLLDVIGEDTMSIGEIMEKLGIKDVKNFKDNYLNPAVRAGLVEPTEKPKHPRQKYRRKLLPLVTPLVTPLVPPIITPLLQDLLDAIGEENLSIREIMEKLGLKDVKNFKDNYLNPAVLADLVEPTEKPKHPRQKYRRKK